jgi:hypothetical protein
MSAWLITQLPEASSQKRDQAHQYTNRAATPHPRSPALDPIVTCASTSSCL